MLSLSGGIVLRPGSLVLLSSLIWCRGFLIVRHGQLPLYQTVPLELFELCFLFPARWLLRLFFSDFYDKVGSPDACGAIWGLDLETLLDVIH